MATGTPMIVALRVTKIVPMIMGKIPYCPRLGAHFMPKTKSKNPTFAMSGTPTIKMKTVITARAARATSAITKNNP